MSVKFVFYQLNSIHFMEGSKVDFIHSSLSPSGVPRFFGSNKTNKLVTGLVQASTSISATNTQGNAPLRQTRNAADTKTAAGLGIEGLEISVTTGERNLQRGKLLEVVGSCLYPIGRCL